MTQAQYSDKQRAMAHFAMHRHIYLLVLCLIAAITNAQCPNTLAVYNPSLRTACTNASKSMLECIVRLLLTIPAYFIVPVNTATVQTAVAPYKLLPLPTSDATLFPNGFPAGQFPVIVSSGLESDIRMSSLQLMSSLLQGSVRVPYVDRLGDGKTPFQFSVEQYIGGVNGQDVSGLVPGKFSGEIFIRLTS